MSCHEEELRRERLIEEFEEGFEQESEQFFEEYFNNEVFEN